MCYFGLEKEYFILKHQTDAVRNTHHMHIIKNVNMFWDSGSQGHTLEIPLGRFYTGVVLLILGCQLLGVRGLQ